MIYESEVIHEILEQRGHELSSLHYESECIESWIEENKGAYPKLCDYQSEWLNYINENIGIGDFPYVTLTDVTDATINNVVPLAYKSATLKGSTKYRDIDTGDILDTFDETKNLELVSVKAPVLKTTGKNLFDEINGSFKEKNSVSSTTGEITYYPSHVGVFENYIPVKPNTTYTLSGQLTDGNNPVFRVAFYQKDKAFNKTNNKYVANNGGGNRTSYTFTTSENEHYIRFSFGEMTQGYFQLEEGTIATKYEPFKSNILTCNEDVTLRSNGNICDELNLLTGQLTQRIDEDGEVLSQVVVKTVDLMIINQDGETISKIKPFEGMMNIEVTGSPIPPTATLEIPVEAITQNLNSFIEEE